MTNKKIEKIIQTYKSILIDTNNVNKDNIIFFARRSIENYNKKKYNNDEQKILDSLLDYYTKPTRKKENIVNSSILDYYQSLNNKQEPLQKKQAVQQDVQVQEPEQVQEQEPDNFNRIKNNKSAMKRTLNLYDIPLKKMDDEKLHPMEDDQLNYSREIKRQFLLKKLREIGQFKCNSIMGSELRNVKNPDKRLNPFFQTKYHIIRNENDIEDYLKSSEKDIINRVGKFMKKTDQKKISFNNSKEIKEKSVFESEDEDDYAFNNQVSMKKKKKKSVFQSEDEDDYAFNNQVSMKKKKKSVFQSEDEEDYNDGGTRGNIEESDLIKKLAETEGQGYYADEPDIEVTIYTSSGCQSEQINIVPISNVFANGFIELPQKIKNTKSCVNIKNKDDRCFLWCHLLQLRYRLNENKKIDHPERLIGEKAYIYNLYILRSLYDNLCQTNQIARICTT